MTHAKSQDLSIMLKVISFRGTANLADGLRDAMGITEQFALDVEGYKDIDVHAGIYFSFDTYRRTLCYNKQKRSLSCL